MLSLILIYRIKPFIVPAIVLTILTTLLCSCTANVVLSTQNQQLNKFRNFQNDNRHEFQHFNRIVKDTNKLFLNDFNLRKTNIERWKRLSETELFTRARRKRRSLNLINTNININSSTKLINLSNNNLTKINISDLVIRSDVESINLSNNKLIVLQTDLKQFFNLKNFDLSKNNIKSVELINNKLLLLNLSCNFVEKFTSENITNLQYLDLSCNQISDFNKIKLNFLNKIEDVNLSCNKIVEIPLNLFSTNSTKLKNLNLSFNRLRKISKKTFYNLINIENLILSYNNISEIENDTFTFLPNLQHLDLSYNNIQPSSIRSLQGIPDLIGLSLAYNPNLSNALQGFVASWSLKELDASGTNLCQIPAALAQSVRTLKLMDNNFQVIRCGDLDSYPLLQHLILSSCQINDIEDDALGRLEILTTLNLNKNKLFRIPTSLPSNLKNLLLKSNKITDIQSNSFTQLINLELLDLSENKLIYIPELPLPKLQSLNLRSSGLKGLSQAVVKTSPHLKDLLLENNPIKCADLLGLAEWATPCREIDIINFQQNTFDYFEKWTPNKCNSHENFHFITETAVYCPIIDLKFNHLENDVKEQFDINKKNNSLFMPNLKKINSQDRRLLNKNITNFQDAKNLILSGKENQTTKLSDVEKWKIFMPAMQKKIKFNDNKLDDKKIIKSGLNEININNINTSMSNDMIINWNENNSISKQPNNENTTNIKHQIMDDVILSNKMVQVEQTKDVIEKNNVKYEEIKLPTPQTPQPLALKLPMIIKLNQSQIIKENQTSSMNFETIFKKIIKTNNLNLNGNGSHIQQNSTSAISMNKKISDGNFVENSYKTVVKNHSDDSIYIAENSLNVEIENKIENNMKNNNKKNFIKLTHLPENLLSINSTHPEHWNDIRTTTNHPGTFVIIGATIGMILSLALVQIYRFIRPWNRQRSNTHEEDADQPYTPAHCDLLPMEILHSPIYATDAPLEIW